MNYRRALLGLALTGFVLGCSKGGISKETYVQVMTDLGCNLLVETAPGATAIYSKHSVTQADIDAFRKNGREDVLTAATTIADNVAKCFGAKYPQ